MHIFNVLGIRLKFMLLLLFSFLGRDVLTPALFLLLCRHVVKPGFVLSGWRILLLTSSFRQFSFNPLIFLDLCLFLLKLVDFIEVDRAINLLNLHQDSTLFFFSLLLLLLVILFKFNKQWRVPRIHPLFEFTSNPYQFLMLAIFSLSLSLHS